MSRENNYVHAYGRRYPRAVCDQWGGVSTPSTVWTHCDDCGDSLRDEPAIIQGALPGDDTIYSVALCGFCEMTWDESDDETHAKVVRRHLAGKRGWS